MKKLILMLGLLLSLTYVNTRADTSLLEVKMPVLTSSIEVNDRLILKKKFEVTYYSNDPACNGIYNGKVVDALGNELVQGTIACNQLPLGTQVAIDGMNYIVRDRGSSEEIYFDKIKINYIRKNMRIDIFIPRNEDEETKDYYHRVEMMGRPILEGYIILDREILEEIELICPRVTKEDYELWLQTDEAKEFKPPSIEEVLSNGIIEEGGI